MKDGTGKSYFSDPEPGRVYRLPNTPKIMSHLDDLIGGGFVKVVGRDEATGDPVIVTDSTYTWERLQGFPGVYPTE